MDSSLQGIADLIESKCPDAFLRADSQFGELTVEVTPVGLPAMATVLKDGHTCRFATLVDITAVDYPSRPERFDLVYHFLSMHENQRLRLKAALRDGEIAPSIVGVYPAANWFEREIFDMYGIMFSGHPDLRRILTDYGFSGHPLRKDFPTTGYVELRYDEAEKRVVYAPVKLVQEYRQFDFRSPWEGMGEVFSGTDKAEGQ